MARRGADTTLAWLVRWSPLLVALSGLVLLVGAVADHSWLWSAVDAVTVVVGPLLLLRGRRGEARSAAAVANWPSERVAEAVDRVGPRLVPRVAALRKADPELSLLDATRLVTRLLDTV